MIEIKSPEEYNLAVKSFKAYNPKALTNCFLMPGEIEYLIAEGRLFISEYPGWLIILCDREDYSNLYYYTTDTSDVSFVKKFMRELYGRDVYLDVVSRAGRGDLLTAQKLVEEGIAEEYKSYQRMQLPVKNIDFNSLSVAVPNGYNLTDKYCNSEAMNELWKATLDEKSTPLPEKDELEELCKSGNLFSILDENGELAAVIMLSVSSKQGLVQHLAVSENHRRKGLARSLMSKCLIAAKDKELTVVRLWVDRKNMSAIALYDRIGYISDGMICDQLYMKGN